MDRAWLFVCDNCGRQTTEASSTGTFCSSQCKEEFRARHRFFQFGAIP